MQKRGAMGRRGFLKKLAGGAAACGWAGGGALARPRTSTKKPNVLFILIDDMGWMDSALYGSRYYETPNIARLARRGMMFSDAYAASPLCSPTRASILTGKYPGRLGITTPAGHLPPRPDQPLLAKRAAEWMKMVCPRSKRFLPLEEYTMAEAFKDAGYATAFIGKWHLGHEPWWPRKQGFDINVAGGQYPGPPSYFSPYRIKTLEDGPEGEYITDRLTDETLEYLESRRGAEEPFFLCLWHYAVHAPFQGKEDLTEKYRGKTDPRGQQKCPVMGAMLQSMDESIGRVMEKIDALGMADDTIVIFVSDNGGNMYNEVQGETPTNNHPLRSGKGNIHEGGTRVPCMVVWPGVVEAGSKSDAVISTIDFYPTLMEMTGIEPKGETLFDGESLVPLLKGEGGLKREAIFWDFAHYMPAPKNLPSISARKGDWKLIRVYGEGPDRSAAFELYNLREDIGESKNLADKMPQKVREMDALITRHIKECGVIEPIPNPDYNPEAYNPMTGKGKRPRRNKEIAGWTAAGTCSVSLEKTGLRVESTGNDPHIHTSQIPDWSGEAVLKYRMRLQGAGEGQIYWIAGREKQFHRDRSVEHELRHDGEWRDYAVTLPVKGKLKAVRIDPGATKYRIDIAWIRLCAPGGRVLKEWDFSKQ